VKADPSGEQALSEQRELAKTRTATVRPSTRGTSHREGTRERAPHKLNEECVSDHFEPEPALDRWRGRLRAVPAKAALRETAVERLRERPRTVQEAADELGLSVHTIRAWIASRRLSYLRLGRAIRIPAAEIRRVIEESTVPAVKEE
jgi:excisionase family DNA binding protein